MSVFRHPIWRVVITVAILILGVSVFFIEIPYDLQEAGGVLDASDIISFDHDNNTGQLYGTYVHNRQAKVTDIVIPWFNKDTQLVSHDDFVIPDDFFETEEFRELRREGDMHESQINALAVAFREAGRPYELRSEGIYVYRVSPLSSFYNEIQPGDQIISINDKPFLDSFDLLDYVESLNIGDTITVDYRRDGELHTSTGILVQDQSLGTTSLGVYYSADIDFYSYENVSVLVDRGMRGNSAGLMLTLEVYSQLTGDITKGRVIAGTGSIDRHGNVGRIGGIEMKVVAADKAGAEIFFVPDDTITEQIAKVNPKIRSNYRDAVRAAIANKIDMEIVPVKTFSDALHYLNQLP